MNNDGGFSRSQLDELVITIELTLVSLAQSLALATLATSALQPVLQLNWQFWPYVASGLILILFFWTQAISHALTFINWPLNMAHNVVYFLAMLVEVMLFSVVTDPLRWFAVNAAFYVVGAAFFWIDLAMIRRRKADFQRAGHSDLFRELEHDQLLALRVLIPFGFLYSVVSALAIAAFPASFITNHGHVWLGLFQAGIGLIILVRSLRDFRHHATLLTSE